MDSHSAQQGGPSTHLTVGFYPPQWAAEMRGAALGRLDARLLHLHARTPQTRCAPCCTTAPAYWAHT